MAFAQLTYRESLRDIEVCLADQAGKHYRTGIGAVIVRSTLADANESRNWGIPTANSLWQQGDRSEAWRPLWPYSAGTA